MAFPFLMLEDIDEVWEEMIDSRPDLNDLNSKKLDEFVEYFENTWLNEKSTNSQQVKDASIALLKQKYKNNELEVMDYLMKISAFVKNHN